MIAKRIYERFIETDDENIIKTVNFVLKFYREKQQLTLLKSFWKWRAKSKRVKVNVFDKLYLEGEKKSNKTIMSEELKELNELKECTFQPNVNKSKKK